MIYNKTGDTFEYRGKKYVVGEQVIANIVSDYCGLIGTIKEIQTGQDKDTDNKTPDIICSFEEPFLEQDKEHFKRVFQDLKEPSLDLVVMAPEMIEQTDALFQKRKKAKTIYLLVQKLAMDWDVSETYEIFTDLERAELMLRVRAKKEKESKPFVGWEDSQMGERSYNGYYKWFVECEEDGYYYEIFIEALEIESEEDDITDGCAESYYKRCRALFDKAKSLGVELEFNAGNFSPKRLNCLWYGGNIAKIKVSEELTVTIDANGAVIVRLLDEYGEELVYSKDESNHGAFEDNMLPYLKTDKQLHKAIEDGKLVFINNNWIEYGGYILDEETGKKQFIDLGMITDNVVDDDILEAINQVLDSLEQVVLEIKSVAENK